MPLRIGIIGLPNVGKSTLFNAITKLSASVSNYPFTTIEPNVGIVEVPDFRTKKIAQIMHSKKVVEATIEFVDIAGLVKGASKGEGLGNQFLSNIRQVDAIGHVVRCFEDSTISHVNAQLNPKSDIEVINTELILADLESVIKKLQDLEKRVKSLDKQAKEEYIIAEKIKQELEKGNLLANAPLTEEEKIFAKELFLLTIKPQIIIANVGEEFFSVGKSVLAESATEKAKELGFGYILISSKIENELNFLSQEEENQFRQSIGIKTEPLKELITASYKILGLSTFFTANSNEAHAWAFEKGIKLPKAAGKIHSDMEKGFISAEVVSFDVLERENDFHKVKEKGLLRIEGKNYEPRDGDIINVRFNV